LSLHVLTLFFEIYFARTSFPRHPPLRLVLCYLGFRETKGAPDAFFDAEGLQPLVDPVAAKGTFLRTAIPGGEADRIIWAGIGADLASGAFRSVDKDNPILPLIDGPFFWAGL